MSLSRKEIEILRRILEHPTDDFEELVQIAELDPKFYFRFANLVKANFGSGEHSDYDFTGAIFEKESGVEFDGAAVRDLSDIALSRQGRRMRHRGWALCCAIFPDDKRIVSAGADHVIYIWDWASGTQMSTMRGHLDWVRDCAVSPDGR